MEEGNDLTVGDVAKLAGVTTETVRAWETSGKLVGRRTAGGQRLFRRSDAVAFLEKRAKSTRVGGVGIS